MKKFPEFLIPGKIHKKLLERKIITDFKRKFPDTEDTVSSEFENRIKKRNIYVITIFLLLVLLSIIFSGLGFLEMLEKGYLIGIAVFLMAILVIVYNNFIVCQLKIIQKLEEIKSSLQSGKKKTKIHQILDNETQLRKIFSETNLTKKVEKYIQLKKQSRKK